MPKAPKYPAGNPDWVEILEEEAQRQADRDPDCHAAKNYKKAAKSMRENPIPMTDPGQALELKFIGAKTVALLKKEIKKRAEAGGRASDDEGGSPPRAAPSQTNNCRQLEYHKELDPFDDNFDVLNRKVTKAAVASDKVKSKPKKRRASPSSSDNDADGLAPPPTKRKTSTTSSRKASTSKSAPQVTPADWKAAMPSRPPSQQSNEETSAREAAARAAEQRRAASRIYQEASQGKAVMPESESRTEHQSYLDDFPFEYYFIDDLGDRTTNITLAETKIADQTQATLVKIEFRSRQALHPIARYITDAQRQPEQSGQPRTEYGFIPRAKVARQAPGFSSKSTLAAAPAMSNGSGSQPPSQRKNSASEARDDLMAGAKAKKPSADRNGMYKMPSSDAVATLSSDGLDIEQPAYRKPASALPRSQSQNQLASPKDRAPSASTSRASSTASTSISAAPSRSASTSQLVLDDLPPPAPIAETEQGAAFEPYRESNLVVMRPGEYKVCLAIDHRERKSASQLEVHVDGVETLVLPLLLADAVWIAVRKQPSGNPEHDMIVLDGALERKRLDDLISSIQDKRYDDQKARFRQTGFTRFYYLLEHYKDSRLLENYEQQMWTVRSQTQIMDSFIILTAKSNTEAVQQHRMLTNAMVQAYEGKTLYGLKKAYTNRQSYLAQLAQLQKAQPDKDYLPTYECFQHVNAKQHTVKSGWAQMLFAQAGMSAEKTAALVEVWPTAAHFWEDIKEQKHLVDSQPVEEPISGRKKKAVHPGEAFVKERCATGGSRDIGPALSKSLWELWTKSAY